MSKVTSDQTSAVSVPPSNGGVRKERPILFSAPMIRALLDGRKTQTRRIIKPPAKWAQQFPICAPAHMKADHEIWWHGDETERVGVVQSCPYGQTGDRLWVRETSMPAIDAGGADYRYAADYDAAGRAGMARLQKWTPAIYMPRKASRIDLDITEVRVQRLIDIGEADAIDEGVREQAAKGWFSVPGVDGAGTSARAAYALLWNRINGPKSWDANPWVWVVEFALITSPTSDGTEPATTAQPASISNQKSNPQGEEHE